MSFRQFRSEIVCCLVRLDMGGLGGLGEDGF